MELVLTVGTHQRLKIYARNSTDNMSPPMTDGGAVNRHVSSAFWGNLVKLIYLLYCMYLLIEISVFTGCAFDVRKCSYSTFNFNYCSFIQNLVVVKHFL